MTMPHLMNCSHSDTGWCLDCVAVQWKDAEERVALIERLSQRLTEIAVSLKGKPPELMLWSWHDLPELAALLVSEKKRLRAHIQEAADRCLSEGNHDELTWSEYRDWHLAALAPQEKDHG